MISQFNRDADLKTCAFQLPSGFLAECENECVIYKEDDQDCDKSSHKQSVIAWFFWI